MLLEKLCMAPGVPGQEGAIRDMLREAIAPLCEDIRTDALGSLIARQKGGNPGGPKVLLCAHMDEVGLIIRAARDDGLLSFFAPGIDPRVLCSKRVKIGEKAVPGVIGCKAIHLQSPAERQQALKLSNLYIDIGCTTRAAAEKLVSPGDSAVFDTVYEAFGDGLIKAKAIDDRGGCASIVEILATPYPDIELWVAFTTQEEIGLRGAVAVSGALTPDIAIVLECTSAGDVGEAEVHEEVCCVGEGPAISFMDRASIANKAVYQALIAAAQRTGKPWQIKRFISGGNDAGALQYRHGPVATGVVSVPCRYIHSPASVCSLADWQGQHALLTEFLLHDAVTAAKGAF